MLAQSTEYCNAIKISKHSPKILHLSIYLKIAMSTQQIPERTREHPLAGPTPNANTAHVASVPFRVAMNRTSGSRIGAAAQARKATAVSEMVTARGASE